MYIYIKSDTDNKQIRIQNEQELKQYIEFLTNNPGVIGLCLDDDATNPRHFFLKVSDEQQLVGYPVRMSDGKPNSILPVYHAVIPVNIRINTQLHQTFSFSSTPCQTNERHRLTDQYKSGFFSFEEIAKIVSALVNKLINLWKEAPSTVSNHTSNTSLSDEQQHILVDELLIDGDEEHEFRENFKEYLEHLEPHVIKAIIQHKPNISLLTAHEQRIREKILGHFFNRNALYSLCERASQKGVMVTPEMARHLYIDLFQNRLAETNEQVPEGEVISDNVEFSAETTNQIKIMASPAGLSGKEEELFLCIYNLLAIPQGRAETIPQYLSSPLYTKHRHEISLMLEDIDGVIHGKNQTTQLVEHQNVYAEVLASIGVDGWKGYETIVPLIRNELARLVLADNLTDEEKKIVRCISNLITAALDKKSIFEHLSQPDYEEYRDEINVILKNIKEGIESQNQSSEEKIYDAILNVFDVSDLRRFENSAGIILKILKIESDMRSNGGHFENDELKKNINCAINQNDWCLCVKLLDTDGAKQFVSDDICYFLKKIVDAKKNDSDFSALKPVLERLVIIRPERGGYRQTISELIDKSIDKRAWGMVVTLLPFANVTPTRETRMVNAIADTIFNDEQSIPKALFDVLTGQQMKEIFSLSGLQDFMKSRSSNNEAKSACLVALETHGLLQPLLREAWKNYKKAHPEERGSVASALFCQLSEARCAYQSTQKTMSDLEPHQRMISRIAPIEAYICNNPNEPFAKMMSEYLNQTTLTSMIRAGSRNRVTPMEGPSNSPSLR